MGERRESRADTAVKTLKLTVKVLTLSAIWQLTLLKVQTLGEAKIVEAPLFVLLFLIWLHWMSWIPIGCFLVWILLDLTTKIGCRSMIPLDLSTKIRCGSMIPLDLTTKIGCGSMIPVDPAEKLDVRSRISLDLSTDLRVWIYDPIGSRIQIHGIRSRDPFLGSMDMSAAEVPGRGPAGD